MFSQSYLVFYKYNLVLAIFVWSIIPCLGFLLLGFIILAIALAIVQTNRKTGFVKVPENLNKTEIDQLIDQIEKTIAR